MNPAFVPRACNRIDGLSCLWIACSYCTWRVMWIQTNFPAAAARFPNKKRNDTRRSTSEPKPVAVDRFASKRTDRFRLKDRSQFERTGDRTSVKPPPPKYIHSVNRTTAVIFADRERFGFERTHKFCERVITRGWATRGDDKSPDNYCNNVIPAHSVRPSGSLHDRIAESWRFSCRVY